MPSWVEVDHLAEGLVRGFDIRKARRVGAEMGNER